MYAMRYETIQNTNNITFIIPNIEIYIYILKRRFVQVNCWNFTGNG